MELVDKDLLSNIRGLEGFWDKRTKKIEEWYRVRALEDKNEVEGFDSVVVNDPKVFCNLSQYMISALPAQHKIPVKSKDEEAVEKIGISERALLSLWRDQDTRQLKRGRRAWRWELSDFLLITGWYSVFAGVVMSGGKPEFLAEIWNPMNVFPEWGDEGLVQVAHKYERTLGQLHAVGKKRGWDLGKLVDVGYGRENSANSVKTVYDYWRKDEDGRVRVSVQVGGKMVLVERERPEFEEIPILVGPAGGEAAWGGYGSSDTGWTGRYGQSILAPNCGLYEAENKNLSYIMQIVREIAQPPIKDTNTGARALVTGEDVKSGAIIHLEPGQDIGPMRQIEFPKELNVVQSVLDQKVQQGSFPSTLVGAVPPALSLSGFAIGLLMTAAQNVIEPYKTAMMYVMSEVDRIWLEGYKRSGVKKLSIGGRSRDRDVTSLFYEDWVSKDVPDVLFVDVTVPLATPSDLIEKITIARTAKPAGDLLDDITILDEILGVEDPHLIKSRLDEQAFAKSLPVQTLLMVMEAKEKEKMLRNSNEPDAAVYADIMADFAMQLMGQLGVPAPGSPSPATPGIRSQVGGTELARGVSPDRARQVGGTPPPQRAVEEGQSGRR
uniref:Portal protein n=1 Tax=viral metagenome TaxID=1070528 RepID=A0A6M3INY7_9ZZZZ